MADILLGLSLVALVFTKVADVVTTIRFVNPEQETNPFARRLFGMAGFGKGIVIVCVIWTAIAGVTYAVAFLQSTAIFKWLTALTGFFISWIQGEAARFNATGRNGYFTRAVMKAYVKWGQSR